MSLVLNQPRIKMDSWLLWRARKKWYVFLDVNSILVAYRIWWFFLSPRSLKLMLITLKADVKFTELSVGSLCSIILKCFLSYSTSPRHPWSDSRSSLDPVTPWLSCATLSRVVTARIAGLQCWRRPQPSSAQRRPEYPRRQSPRRKLNKPLYYKGFY